MKNCYWPLRNMTHIIATLQAASSPEASRIYLQRHQTGLMGLNPSNSEVLFGPASLFFKMTSQNSPKTERKSFMPFHFSLAGLQNGLSLIFPISQIKTQSTSSMIGPYSNKNSSTYLGTEMKLDGLRIEEGGNVTL
ncbi:hypothetical protein O181_014573 [Austropuccinia psidii MF-1]|uniref:Uncharacterized protein n=1 Tax=Austropuccinia psidii MF-1 TaxID=1389203 RepID=A0A9Q3C0T2_9BASI|nr:hypothetical protein [Austropuccinia psidii MF-1]